MVDLLLKVKAQAYVIEAGNVRHEHEWKIWRTTKLPEGKVGRENVIAGTDCGLGGRVHPQIAWAKLEALSEGAKLATKELWS